MPHIRTVIRASVLALPMVFGAANASTLTVTSTNDSGGGSLRQAIGSAAPGDLIVFDPAATGTIALATSLTIAQSVTIQGPGAGNITLDGQSTVRVISLTAGTLTLSGVTIANGLTVARGGGVEIGNGATLNVSDSLFTGNQAANGGAIDNGGGTLTVATSTFQNNTATSVGGGSIINSGTATVTGNTFLDNAAPLNGGAVNNQPSGVLTLENNTFSGNSTSGAGGGAVSNLGTMTVINDSFSGNSAADGAAIATGPATMTLYNNVFADNVAASSPGAISPASTGTLSHNVFFNNTAGGVEDDQTGYGSSNFVTTGAEPLGPLANNGGPTQTQLPLPAGAAVCAGSVALLPGGLTTDQRGFPRTSLNNGTPCVDAGSVETPGAIPTLATSGLILFGGLLAMFGIRRMRRPAR